MIEPHAPTTIETARLRLRTPRADDVGFEALHADPGGYSYAPGVAGTDRGRAAALREQWVEHWATQGYGYWVVEEKASGREIGMAGLRSEESLPGPELFCRLPTQFHGRGYGREVVRASLAWAAEWLPEARPVAVVRDGDEAAERTAASAGMARTGSRAGEDGAPGSTLWQPPVVAREEPADGLFDEMLDLWCAVNAAGGAVGFLPDAPRDVVAERLGVELGATCDDVPLVTLRAADDGRLLGFCWWVRDSFELFRHSVVLKRFMVTPSEQGRGYGSLLLSGAHAVARSMPDVELLRLHYRSGLGLGLFYGRHGWTETGRTPRLIRVGSQDYRDSVEMTRRPDGKPPVADGRL